MPRGNTKSTRKRQNTMEDPKPRRSRKDVVIPQEPQVRNSWSTHDLMAVRPLTDNQRVMCEAFQEGYNIIAFGSAGSGKTFLALYLACDEILYPRSKTNNIVIVRSAVQTRDMGYMPGDLDEKMMLYELPYRDILCELIGRYSTYDDMKKAGLVYFSTTSFLRGLTYNNSIVIVDEVQNMTFHEINSIMTRLGENSRFIALGDLTQGDLSNRKQEITGMERFLRIGKRMDTVQLVEFTRDDIVRSSFVKDWIIACEETT